MTTAQDQFTEAVALFVRGTLLKPIVSFLKDVKGMEVSLEDLVQVLHLPTPMASPRYVGSVPPVVQTRRTTRASLTTSPTEGAGCAYKFKRGAKTDKLCGKKCAAGSIYCRTHSKSSNPRKKTTALRDPSSPSTHLSESSETPILDVEYFGPENSGYFKHSQMNFIIKQIQHGNEKPLFVCVGKLEESPEGEKTTFRLLNEEEKRIASSLSLAILDDEESKQEGQEVLKHLPSESEDSPPRPSESPLPPRSSFHVVEKKKEKEKDFEAQEEEPIPISEPPSLASSLPVSSHAVIPPIPDLPPIF